jgi:anti-sigma regulatory factor (Ser/Thr protein kinase)
VLADVRAWLRGLVADLAGEHRADVVLVGVELVTNAIEHGGGPQWMRLARRDDPCLVRIEVADSNLGQLTLGTSRFGPAAHRGNGLVLVRGMSHGWGVHRDAIRMCKTVWTTLSFGHVPPR